MKVKNQYLKILEYLYLSFNKWPSIQYKFWVSLVLWNTIMGNTADLATVQKMIVDTLHKESKPQRVITERGGWSRSAVSKHIQYCEEEIGYEKVHKQQGWPQAWEYCQSKLIQTLGRASQGVNWIWSQCIKSHHAQTSSGKELPRHFWNRDNIRNILPGIRRRTGLLQSLEEEWRDTESMFLKSSVKFPQSVMIWAAMSSAGVGPLCFLKSTVNAAVYQDIVEHFMLPSADKLYGDADFIFQQDLAPAHTAKGTKSWFSDHGVTVFDWPANSPDLNPIENLDERHQTQQCRWPKPHRESRWETPDPTIQMTWTPENLDERHQTQQYRWPEPQRI